MVSLLHCIINNDSVQSCFAHHNNPQCTDPEINSSVALTPEFQDSPQETSIDNVRQMFNASTAGSSMEEQTHCSARSRDPPSTEEALGTSNPPPYEYSFEPIHANNNAVRGSATSVPSVARPSTARELGILPSFKQQCMATGAGSNPRNSGEPILVQADPISESQLAAERQMEEQRMSQQTTDQSRDRQSQQEKEHMEAASQSSRRLLCLGAFALLILLALGVAAGGVCGTGHCSPSSSSRGLPVPSPSTPGTPSPTTTSPTMAPIPLTREALVTRTINDMTLSTRRIQFPLPNNPTPEEEALSWLILDDPSRLPASRTVALIQRYVLATLWFSDVVPQTEDYVASWLILADECDWEGVLDCRTDAIVSLQLTENTATGRLPVDLGLLTALTRLVFVDNSLVGTIPSSLGRLTELKNLSFEGNTLSGTIPSSLGLLTQLTQLSLFENSLRGTIPDLSNLGRLQALAMFQNGLEETLPTGLASLTSKQCFTSLHPNPRRRQHPRRRHHPRRHHPPSSSSTMMALHLLLS